MRAIIARLALAASLTLPLPALAAEWAVDHSQSTLGFEGTVMGGGFEGHFESWQGDIRFDPADPASGSADITIDMGSAVTGDASRDEAVVGTDWFDTANHPTARFTASTFRQTGEGAYEADGELTIRGNTRAVTLPFTFAEADGTAKVTGALPIDRTDYGVGQGDFVSGATVGKEVTITLSLTATPAAE